MEERASWMHELMIHAQEVLRQLAPRLLDAPSIVFLWTLFALWWLRRELRALLASGEPKHARGRVQIVITVGALGLTLLHVTTPQLAIDSITLVLLVAAAVPWLIPLFEKIELPGGVKLTFRDLDETGQRAQAAGLLGITPPSVPPRMYSFQLVSDEDPNLALAGLRIEIERRLANLATAAGVQIDRTNIRHLLQRLAAQSVLTQEQSSVLMDMIGLLNTAAHGALVDRSAAAWALQVGPSLLATLDFQIAEQRGEAYRTKTESQIDTNPEGAGTALLRQLNRLRDQGVRDPDIDLFIGVFTNNLEMVRAAIENGADVNITDSTLLERHRELLKR